MRVLAVAQCLREVELQVEPMRETGWPARRIERGEVIADRAIVRRGMGERFLGEAEARFGAERPHSVANRVSEQLLRPGVARIRSVHDRGRDAARTAGAALRTNISYRRVRSAHPVVFQQLFPPKDASWAQRQLFTPFYGKTAVVVELNAFPLSPGILRLFLAPQMFSPRSKGLVFLVPDWMAFSTELDSFRGTWLQNSDRLPQRVAAARR